MAEFRIRNNYRHDPSPIYLCPYCAGLKSDDRWGDKIELEMHMLGEHLHEPDVDLQIDNIQPSTVKQSFNVPPIFSHLPQIGRSASREVTTLVSTIKPGVQPSTSHSRKRTNNLPTRIFSNGVSVKQTISEDNTASIKSRKKRMLVALVGECTQSAEQKKGKRSKKQHSRIEEMHHQSTVLGMKGITDFSQMEEEKSLGDASGYLPIQVISQEEIARNQRDIRDIRLPPELDKWSQERDNRRLEDKKLEQLKLDQLHAQLVGTSKDLFSMTPAQFNSISSMDVTRMRYGMTSDDFNDPLSPVS